MVFCCCSSSQLLFFLLLSPSLSCSSSSSSSYFCSPSSSHSRSCFSFFPFLLLPFPLLPSLSSFSHSSSTLSPAWPVPTPKSRTMPWGCPQSGPAPHGKSSREQYWEQREGIGSAFPLSIAVTGSTEKELGGNMPGRGYSQQWAQSVRGLSYANNRGSTHSDWWAGPLWCFPGHLRAGGGRSDGGDIR